MTRTMILPREGATWRRLTPGVYENHHLLCPTHGRTVPSGDGLTASCGCTPVIQWATVSHGEAEMFTGDTLGLGRRHA